MPDAYTLRRGETWLVASVYWRSISAAARAMQVAGVPRSATHWLLLGRHLGVMPPTPAHPPETLLLSYTEYSLSRSKFTVKIVYLLKVA
ncbi:hypothetical protein B5X24_HaOG215219 [Helicoverpa armigera]|nr:hypothetical protein B5X24_HaOG215219 [Helicoverpa armigera]